jgi:hypothetical protein
MALGRYFLSGSTATVLAVLYMSSPSVHTQNAGSGPAYKFDSGWPKPLPGAKDAGGKLRTWISGGVGTHCIDSRDHVFQFNRSYLNPTEFATETTTPAPPVVEIDPAGNVVNSWGDPTLTPEGTSAVLPHNTHGCFVDYEGNVWVGSNGDGVVQKWSRDGKRMLLQIGTKGVCDGPPTLSPKSPYPTCGAPGNNSSRTLLNEAADVAVDPNPDPVTKERGSVYIADGYGNHRIVVFNSEGQFLRQWGSAGTGAGQFYPTGGGHPHCVGLGNDSLVYACDRSGNRIQVFDRVGNLQRIINVIPPTTSATGALTVERSVSDIAFSPDPEQKFIYVVYYGCGCASPEGGRIYILDRKTGAIVGSFGGPGPAPGQFLSAHSIGVDSKGNVYIGESPMGRRLQRFLKISG